MVALLFRQHSMLSVPRILSTGKRRGIRKVPPSFRRAALASIRTSCLLSFRILTRSHVQEKKESQGPATQELQLHSFYVWTCPSFGLLTGPQKVIRHPRAARVCAKPFQHSLPRKEGPSPDETFRPRTTMKRSGRRNICNKRLHSKMIRRMMMTKTTRIPTP